MSALDGSRMSALDRAREAAENHAKTGTPRDLLPVLLALIEEVDDYACWICYGRPPGDNA